MHFSHVSFSVNPAFTAHSQKCIHSALDMAHLWSFSCIPWYVAFWRCCIIIASKCIHHELHGMLAAFCDPLHSACILHRLHFFTLTFCLHMCALLGGAYLACTTNQITFWTVDILLHSDTFWAGRIWDAMHACAYKRIEWCAAFWICDVYKRIRAWRIRAQSDRIRVHSDRIWDAMHSHTAHACGMRRVDESAWMRMNWTCNEMRAVSMQSICNSLFVSEKWYKMHQNRGAHACST